MKKLNFRENLEKIFKEHRSLFVAMVLLLIVSLMLMIYVMVNLNSRATVIKSSYSDIGRYQGGEWSSMQNAGGYYDGRWTERLAYLILALVFGVLHNLIAIRIFTKKGEKVALFFVIFTFSLVLSTF